MTIRSCCGVLAALLAAALAQAQQFPSSSAPPTGYPYVPVPLSSPSPLPPAAGYYSAPPSVPPCVTPAGPVYVPTPAVGWTMSVAKGGKVQIQITDGSAAICETLTILVPGAKPLQVTADKQIHLRCGPEGRTEGCANRLEASADRVHRNGPGGMVLTLEGNAKVFWVRKGLRAEVSAALISLNLATGQVEGKAATELAPPPPPQPTTQSSVGLSPGDDVAVVRGDEPFWELYEKLSRLPGTRLGGARFSDIPNAFVPSVPAEANVNRPVRAKGVAPLIYLD